MVDEVVGKVAAIFKNEYGYAFKVEEEENKINSYFLNKNKSVDPLGYDLGFIHGQVVHIVYWTTSSGNKLVNNLKIITDKAEQLQVYDGEVINVYPELGGIKVKENQQPQVVDNKDNKDQTRYNDHYYIKETYFIQRAILEELRSLVDIMKKK